MSEFKSQTEREQKALKLAQSSNSQSRDLSLKEGEKLKIKIVIRNYINFIFNNFYIYYSFIRFRIQRKKQMLTTKEMLHLNLMMESHFLLPPREI